MSKDLLLLPDKINNPTTGYIAQKAGYAALLPGLQLRDSGQKVFSDNWIGSVAAYHSELAALNKDTRTNYVEAPLIEAAQGIKNDAGHFTLAPFWTNLTPKLVAANNANPRSVGAGPNELETLAPITSNISMLLTGFNDGLGTFGATLAGTALTTDPVFLGDLTPGSRIVMTSGGTQFIVTVVSYLNPDGVITPLTGVPADGHYSCTQNLPGFTNAQRSGTAFLPNAGIYALYRDAILAAVSVWKTNVNAQHSALLANGDLVNAAHVAAALTAVNTALATITTWQGLPDLAVNGLLSDNGLAPLQSEIATRTVAIPARVVAIGADLGTVLQNTDGTYSGPGAYFELFKLVDMRASLGTGTLTQCYDNLRNQAFFDKIILAANNQIAQYQSVMYASRILADTVLGQDTFIVDTVTGLAVTDAVLVMDNTSITYSRTILQITGTTVKLSSGIPTILTAAGLARIVKMK